MTGGYFLTDKNKADLIIGKFIFERSMAIPDNFLFGKLLCSKAIPAQFYFNRHCQKRQLSDFVQTAHIEARTGLRNTLRMRNFTPDFIINVVSFYPNGE